MKRWIDPLLAARGVTDTDVEAGHHVRVLRHLVAMENRVVRLARGEYELEGIKYNAAHNAAEYWNTSVWRKATGR